MIGVVDMPLAPLRIKYRESGQCTKDIIYRTYRQAVAVKSVHAKV